MPNFKHGCVTVINFTFAGLEDTPGSLYNVRFDGREGEFGAEWWSTRHSSGLDVYDNVGRPIELTDQEDTDLTEAIERFSNRLYAIRQRMNLDDQEERALAAALTVTEVGDRVRAVKFGREYASIDDNRNVPPGTEGRVNFIDDGGTVHVDWDNGRRLGMVPGIDQWEVL